MHVDTGHNFPEVIEFRDRRVAELGERLIVASVQESIDKGRVVEETGPRASRNRLQTTTLLDAIDEHGFDAAFGGARRDEERARAKERIFSFRDDFGGWDPKRQRPELWNLYNGRIRRGEHVRVFPLSNWTELDVWQYIAEEELEMPAIYFAHEREVFRRDGMLYAHSDFVELHRPARSRSRARPLPHRRRHDAAPARSSRRRRRCDDVVAEIAATRDHRARRDPRRRPRRRGRDGRPQGRGLLLRARTALLRLATAGSVDDGKSTLIGRLLYDTKSILADQLEQVRRRRGAAAATAASTSSLLTDGLRAEREQGITIDVAYRYFATPRRKFILADTPGHVQYTRNMVTGASTADLAIVLVDARHGVVEQTRRHAFIASLLGIPHLVVAVNKMDLVELRRGASSTRIVARVLATSPRQLERHGRRPSSRSARCTATTSSTAPSAMPWYDGPPLLEHLETVELGRRSQPRRRCASRSSGSSAPGPTSPRLPRLRRPGRQRASCAPATRSSCCPAGVEHARSRRSTPSTARSTRRSRRCRVTVRLEDDVDVSRGDMIVARRRTRPSSRARSTPTSAGWPTRPLRRRRARYLLKHTTARVARDRRRDRRRHRRPHARAAPRRRPTLGAQRHRPRAAAHRQPLAFDPYARNRATGAFILIDEATNDTVARA